MEPADCPAVSVQGAWVRFGSALVLRALSLEVASGERLAIFGPNGAGKTTLLRLLTGALRPSAGRVQVAGLDPVRDGRAVRARLGVLSHQAGFYAELTVAENLRLYGRLYDVEPLAERCGATLEQVGLYGRRGARFDSLSRGLQQRLAIARALLHHPPILLLDEPDTGLDLQAHQLLEAALAADAGRTVLLATHNLQQARRLCDRAAVLVDGRLTATLERSEFDPDRLGELFARPAAARG